MNTCGGPNNPYRDAIGYAVERQAEQRYAMEVVEPARSPDVVPDVVVPVLQSMAYALAALMGSLIVCAAAEWPLWWAFAAAGAVFSLCIPWRIRAMADTLWREAHPVLPPVYAPQSHTTRIELVHTGQEGIRQMRILNLPVNPQLLRHFAQAALSGESLAVHRWTGSSGPFTRSEFEQLVAELENAGLLVTERSGRRLTVAGRHVLRHLLETEQ